MSAPGTSSSWTDGSGTSGGNYEYYQKAKIPTKIILPIFTPQNDGADATEKPGDTKWTEGHGERSRS